LAGCGSGANLGTVTGVVTLDGKPFPNGLVTFSPKAGGGSSTGTTDSQGKYELIFETKKGALVGQHLVSVTTQQEAETIAEVRSDSPEYMKQAAGGSSRDYAKKLVERIPAKYNVNSELVKEVKSGKNEINLELTSK
jgi:hypothetical protein